MNVQFLLFKKILTNKYVMSNLAFTDFEGDTHFSLSKNSQDLYISCLLVLEVG
jgi:hypothetical protein